MRTLLEFCWDRLLELFWGQGLEIVAFRSGAAKLINVGLVFEGVRNSSPVRWVPTPFVSMLRGRGWFTYHHPPLFDGQHLMNRLTFPIVLLVLCSAFVARQAHAIPALQLYIEGATFHTGTETWVSSGSPVNLWAIGNTSGPGNHGSIFGVSLYAAYNPDASNVSISLTPLDPPTNFNGVTDLGVAPAAVGPSLGLTPTPVLSDGSLLPWHGIYKESDWVEFGLGNFAETGDDIGDFNGIEPFPTNLVTGGQINAYEVSWSGTDLQYVHFDLAGTLSSGKAKFAPFSHDAEMVPESSSLALWSTVGAVFAVGYWFRRRRRLFLAQDRRCR